MKRVSVHIDRLVLHGFARADGEAIASGLREQLARVLEDANALRALTASGDVPRLRARSVQIDRGARAVAIGEDVARAITESRET